MWAFLVGALVVVAGGCGGSATGTASSESTSAVPAATSSAASPTTAAAPSPLVPGRIAFRRYFDGTESTGAIFTSGTDGSGERQVTNPPASTLDDEPNWAPDGTRLLFTRSTALGHVKGGEIQFSDIVVMDANGSHSHQVTKFAAYSGDAGGVAWSPDGKRLVFARSNAGTTKPDGGRALFIMDVDGRHQRQLTPWTVGAGGTPDWSSKTNLIAFRAVADEESGIGNFFTIRPDGTSLAQVTNFTDTVISHKVGFSRNGQWIVFAKETAPGNNDVFIAKIDGTDMRAVTNTPLADSAPDWGALR